MAPSDDPDAHLVERLLETSQAYRGHFLDVRRDRVALPDGGTAHREYIRHPGAVMVVPLLDDGRLQSVLDDWCPHFDGYYAYYPSRRHVTVAMRTVLDALRGPMGS